MIKYKIFNKNIINPEGIIQVMHGMGEHSLRYLDLVDFFNKKNIVVVLSDHKFHGQLALNNNSLGNFTTSFKTLIQDQVNITNELFETFPKTPIFILAHSMGSFIAQEHLKLTSFPQGYIIIGSCASRKFIHSLGGYFFKALSLFIKKPKDIFGKMLFWDCNLKIKKGNSHFQWLSLNQENVKLYENDPLCGFAYNSKFYYEFLFFLKNLFDKNSFLNVKKNIPIYLLSGKEDPIGLYGKGVITLFDFYKSMGFKNISIKLYPKLRHEILQEDIKKDIYLDILNWIEINKNRE
ncbi:alpha/beta hydrolase [uncultured Cetobacterium sp.]|uniref:serine aminopeptidase domain-containing protein n=1 Tax=uncultured Cetobacterium sp. TaxID=527638 RepID=UPI00260989E9|nr:alpha/beta hydrolase [uncultured Cetobacterium sp.]